MVGGTFLTVGKRNFFCEEEWLSVLVVELNDDDG